MTVLKAPDGPRQQADVPDRNAINDAGQIAATLLVAGQRQAVRWSADGTATALPALPGHTWTNAWSINDDGVVSGWSRQLPNDDGENNPVLWDASGAVVALGTAPGRADGAAEATNRSGLTVGYLGNLGSDTDPERGNAVVWGSATAAPTLLGPPAPAYGYGELVDVNDRGQAAGASGSFTSTGFTLVKPVIWRTGWESPTPLPIPRAARGSSRGHRVCERHQRARGRRRRRLRARGQELRRAPSHRPGRLDLPVRPRVTSGAAVTTVLLMRSLWVWAPR